MKTQILNYIIISLCAICSVYAQHEIHIETSLDPETKVLKIKQQIIYKNTSQDVLNELFFHDWANAFSNKKTPLGERFSEDFLKRFYYAKDFERGATLIQSIKDQEGISLQWERYNNIEDIIRIVPKTALQPGDDFTFSLEYQVKIPSDKFTRYGYHRNGDFSIKYWYITPAVYYQSKWHTYSHKNLDDLFAPASNYQVDITIPNQYTLTSELEKEIISENDSTKQLKLTGNNRTEVNLYLETKNSFYDFKMNGVQFVSNIEDNELMPEMKTVATLRIIKFLEKKLGKYPHSKILVSENDYKINPVYGLNQLPDIVRPFPDGFQYEIKQLKSITDEYLDKTLLVDPRYDVWIRDAIHLYLMMAYTEQFYPEMKLIGNLSKIIGIRWFHIADLDFNDQYFIGYKNMARLFLDQSLDTPQDELVKFNQNISNAYKAGIGLKYLEAYLEDDNIIPTAVHKFYEQNLLQPSTSGDFRSILETESSKNVDWFFNDYVKTNSKIDFKIKSVKKRKDSIEVTIKNKKDNTMPVSLYGFRKKDLVYKTWVTDINGTKKVTIPNDNLSKLALDYDQIIPEYNQRNNYKHLKWIFNKPLEFRLLQDLENPSKSQILFIPEFEFNVYDGLILGNTFFNQTIIRKDFEYEITPSYGFGSNRLLGSASFDKRKQIANHGLYQMRYGISGSTFSYAENLLVRTLTPSYRFYWRPKDLRSNERQVLSFRSVNVFRDRDEANPVETPDYSVFNARYVYSDNNLLNLKSYAFDYQIAQNFSKISTTLNYRKLFLNNRQLNLRLFAGAFLFNDTDKDGNFFSFALDRPTDYLFDFSYLGRSEETGLVSQQIVIAEGGFKSQLEYPFANQWITTFNANTNIWNWIYAYGDIGMVKSKGTSAKFVYDSGIRLSLVADYFELFLPMVSNNGWEISQPNYGEKIRFIITLSPQTLIGLFTREWY